MSCVGAYEMKTLDSEFKRQRLGARQSETTQTNTHTVRDCILEMTEKIMRSHA